MFAQKMRKESVRRERKEERKRRGEKKRKREKKLVLYGHAPRKVRPSRTFSFAPISPPSIQQALMTVR